MATSRSLFLLVAGPSCIVMACTSSPGGADGSSGGAVSTSGGGTAVGSGGVASTGGTSTGDGGSGSQSSGGTSSGGASGSDGLGGEGASGGSANAGGRAGDGGTGAEPYGPCDEDLGEESNPACAAGEVCFHSTCMESCPTDLNGAATYPCPELTSGSPPSQCAFVFGRCELVCEGQGSLPDYDCPVGMDCLYARCVWP